jgi:hypothetical protein
MSDWAHYDAFWLPYFCSIFHFEFKSLFRGNSRGHKREARNIVVRPIAKFTATASETEIAVRREQAFSNGKGAALNDGSYNKGVLIC